MHFWMFHVILPECSIKIFTTNFFSPKFFFNELWMTQGDTMLQSILVFAIAFCAVASQKIRALYQCQGRACITWSMHEHSFGKFCRGLVLPTVTTAMMAGRSALNRAAYKLRLFRNILHSSNVYQQTSLRASFLNILASTSESEANWQAKVNFSPWCRRTALWFCICASACRCTVRHTSHRPRRSQADLPRFPVNTKQDHLLGTFRMSGTEWIINVKTQNTHPLLVMFVHVIDQLLQSGLLFPRNHLRNEISHLFKIFEDEKGAKKGKRQPVSFISSVDWPSVSIPWYCVDQWPMWCGPDPPSRLVTVLWSLSVQQMIVDWKEREEKKTSDVRRTRFSPPEDVLREWRWTPKNEQRLSVQQ